MTGSVDAFTPLKPGHAGIYVCGPTVYDHAHIGHARSAVFFDVVVRYLKFIGYDVVYVRNFTDIDDKIIEKANIENMPVCKLAKDYISSYCSDMEVLGVWSPDHEPRVTKYIPDIIDTVSSLIYNKFAYVADGNVWFRTGAQPGYGRLSGRNSVRDDTAGYRIELNEAKEDCRDFALWKKAGPGTPSWESPWGHGRPGWHIECAVMSHAILGESFDIHGGGRDLIFPHHENERAISLGLTGKESAGYWLHHALVTVNGKKLSKSNDSGALFLVRDLVCKYSPAAIRLLLLSTHYRRQLDITGKKLFEKHKTALNLKAFFNRYSGFSHERPVAGSDGALIREFCRAMNNDFNIPEALDILYANIKSLNHDINLAGSIDALSIQDKEKLREILQASSVIFGDSYDHGSQKP